MGRAWGDQGGRAGAAACSGPACYAPGMAAHFTPHPWALVGRYEGTDVFVSLRAGEVPNGYRSGVAVHRGGDWRIAERALLLDLPRKAAEKVYAPHVTTTV